MNDVTFVASFRASAMDAVWNRAWIGTALWLTIGFDRLTARGLTPARDGG
jgi:hypothetical protein